MATRIKIIIGAGIGLAVLGAAAGVPIYQSMEKAAAERAAAKAAAEQKLRAEEARKAEDAKLIKEAQDAVTKDYKDPLSAQFRNVRVVASGDVCGEVNGRNGFGAYAGFDPFIYFASLERRQKEKSNEAIETLQAYIDAGKAEADRAARIKANMALCD